MQNDRCSFVSLSRSLILARNILVQGQTNRVRLIVIVIYCYDSLSIYRCRAEQLLGKKECQRTVFVCTDKHTRPSYRHTITQIRRRTNDKRFGDHFIHYHLFKFCTRNLIPAKVIPNFHNPRAHTHAHTQPSLTSDFGDLFQFDSLRSLVFTNSIRNSINVHLEFTIRDVCCLCETLWRGRHCLCATKTHTQKNCCLRLCSVPFNAIAVEVISGNFIVTSMEMLANISPHYAPA